MSTKTKQKSPAPEPISLERRLVRAMRSGSMYYKIEPVIAAPAIAEVLLPRVVDHAEGRGIEVDDSEWDAIEARLVEKIETKLLAAEARWRDSLRAQRAAGERIGPWSDHNLQQEVNQIIADLVPTDGNPDA